VKRTIWGACLALCAVLAIGLGATAVASAAGGGAASSGVAVASGAGGGGAAGGGAASSGVAATSAAGGGGAAVEGAAASGAASPVATSPAANATLTAPPRRIVLADPGAGTARVTVYDAAHRTLATATARRAGDALVAPLPALPKKAGVYSVVWDGSGHSGSFAFQVEPGGASPALVQEPQPTSSLTPVARALPKWFAFACIFVFLGTLALRFLVTAPAIARLGEGRPRLGAAVDQRLLVFAGATIALFIPATLAELVYDATDEELGLSFWQSIRPGPIWREFLTGTPDGHLWLIRLGLTALAAAVVIPVAVAALRRGRGPSPRRISLAAGIGLAAATAELLARVIPTEAPDEWAREIFTDLLDWGHMVGASVWIGGLVALGVLAATLRNLPASERDGFWSIALRRFSVVATVCVGVMILTGLWTAWIHVGPPRLLFHTLYGETLLVKLVLVLVLLGLGAVNQLWLLPRVNAMRAAGEEGSALSLTLRHFRGVIAAEAVIGLLVLLVVPFLSGSARRQDFERHAADLTQAATVAGQEVRLRPSGAQPGLTDYDVWAPGADGRVALAFSSPGLEVPPTAVTATSLGGDHYRVSGLYTPMVGDWRARVLVDGASAATFTLPVTAKYEEPESPPPPPVKGSTWAWGIAEVIATLLALIGAGFAARWITALRRRRLA
jgi:putative copper export protein/methionine-rich copper-binding protein CopC